MSKFDFNSDEFLNAPIISVSSDPIDAIVPDVKRMQKIYVVGAFASDVDTFTASGSGQIGHYGLEIATDKTDSFLLGGTALFNLCNRTGLTLADIKKHNNVSDVTYSDAMRRMKQAFKSKSKKHAEKLAKEAKVNEALIPETPKKSDK